LPHPFTAADVAAGYRYELSILQAEFSLTQVLGKPADGRIFFEQVIRDNLGIGRPDQAALVFGRKIIRRGKRPTPGRFRTRVITSGVVPSLHIDYKHSKIKQYHKLGRAIRTETTINDAPAGFGIPKRLTSLPALRQIGFAARANTASSPASPDPAATRSPTPACTTHCCSPTPTTTCCARAWPRPPTPARPHPPGCAPPPAPTRPPTTTSPARPTSPPDQHQPGTGPASDN